MKRLSRSFIEKIFSDRGFVLLDISDEAFTGRKLKYLCSCGRIGYSYYESVRDGCFCRYCAAESISESNKKNWKSGNRKDGRKKETRIAICSYCLKEFEIDSKKCGGMYMKFIRGESFCCSKECANLLRRKRVIVNCSVCGITVERTPSQLTKSGEVFCSIECKGIFYSGSNAPGYIHGEHNTLDYMRRAKQKTKWREVIDGAEKEPKEVKEVILKAVESVIEDKVTYLKLVELKKEDKENETRRCEEKNA